MQHEFNFTELPQFDLAESIRHRDKGIEQAVNNNARLVTEAREIAEQIARSKGVVSMDDVVAEMMRRGYPEGCLKNAAGGVFKTRNWQWTGQFIHSVRIKAHGNLLRTWQLVELEIVK